jgi:predicted DNA-binding transcriptional regulator AlpA
MPPTAVPTLDELASNPERARDLSADTARALAWKCLTALTALHVATSLTGTHAGAPMRADDGERLLTVPEVAERIGMSTSWVEKHTGDLPARVSVAGNPRWRKSDLERWIKNRPEYGKA